MKQYGIAAVLFCAAVLGGRQPSEAGEIHKFDMGPQKSPVWPGFELVTAETVYTPERGYGWVSAGRISERQTSRPDDLCRDAVSAKGPLEFRLDLRNGDYQVCVLSGDNNDADYLSCDRRVLAEGKEMVRAGDEFWDLQDRDYVPGECIWEKYIRDRYLQRTFPVTVRDGALNLVFEARRGDRYYAMPVNCIMVYPAGQSERMTRAIEEITKKRREAFLATWTEKTEVNNAPPLKVDAEAKRLGYVTFARNYLKSVLPNTTPEVAEYDAPLRTYAAAGEWEPVSLCIRPIRDLKGVSVTVSDLRSGRATIPSGNVRVCVVKYIEQAHGRTLTYIVAPFSLMHWWKKIDIPAGLTKQYWLKTWIPEDAEPGFYSGTLTVSAENAPSKEVPLTVRVLPFRLMRSKHASFFYFGGRTAQYFRRNGPQRDEGYWAMRRKDGDLLREHGFCPRPSIRPYARMIAIKVDKERKKLLSINFDALDREMEMRKRIGALPPDGFIQIHTGIIAKAYCGCEHVQIHYFNPRKYIRWTDDPKDEELFIEIVKEIDRHVRGRGWGTPVFEAVGELTAYREDGLKWGMGAYGCLKKAGVLTANRSNGLVDLEVMKAGLVDYAIPNTALMRDKWTDTMKKHCKGLWLYNYSRDRYGFGFFAWKKGATRRLHEGYMSGYGRPWDEFDHSAQRWFVGAEPTREGSVGLVTFQHMAEGRDDYDYVHTCETLIKQAKGRGGAEARRAASEAEATLKYIADNAFTDVIYKGDPALPGQVSNTPGFKWQPDDFQKFRWLVAREIMRLQEALE